MRIPHEHYEELCALAASAQIAPHDAASLREHTETCAECRQLLADFGQIAAQALPNVSNYEAAARPAGMTDRFIARAHSEGVPLRPLTSDQVITRRTRSRVFRPLALAIAAIIVLPFIVSLKPLRIYRPLFTRKNDESLALSSTRSASNTDLIDRNAELSKQVESLRTNVSQLTTELSSAKHSIEDSRSTSIQASTRLTEGEEAKRQLRNEITYRDAQLAQLTAEIGKVKEQLETLRSAKASDELVADEAQKEMNDLRASVASLTEELNESKQLSAAANEAKDLIKARNLHIIDVDDTDGNGKRRRPFGRIFYTEGKNLIFYAYDLADPQKLNAKIFFHVWGSREGVNQAVHSLGIFQADDEREARWVLRFDDPGVLAKINCVFVTAESAKKSATQPTGKQILFASLGSKANHP